jgi:histidinol-phosphate phosphatase family protein
MSMRIALVSGHASPLAGPDGGQHGEVARLARHLARRGHAVEVLTRRYSAALPCVAEWPDGVRVVHLPAGPPQPRRPEDLLPLMEEFTAHAVHRARRAGYDLVHAHFFTSALVATELKRLLGIPFVVSFHELGRVRRLHGADDFPDRRLTIEARAVAEADRILAACPQDKADLLAHYQAPPGRVRTIPCGFDANEFAPMDRGQARAALGLDPDERLVLRPGRLAPHEGAEDAVRALARLRDEHGLEARLLVVGGEARDPDPGRTPEIARLRDVAASEGVADRVTFVGRRDRHELRAWYAAADVVVHAPWFEPSGRTVIEAMACGVPVVGSDVGGIKMAVRDGVTGLLAPPKDPAAVAACLARLFRDPDLCTRMGRRAARRARARFTWRRVGAAVERLYAEVLGLKTGRKPPPRAAPSRAAEGRAAERGGAVFLDLNGALVENPDDVLDPGRLRLAPGVADGLAALAGAACRVVVVSHQPGVARGLFPETALAGVERSVRRLLAACGVGCAGFYWCPHDPAGSVPPFAVSCWCRKPAPGLLHRAAADLGLDLSRCWMVGDVLDDVEAGRAAGCRTVLIDDGQETEWHAGPARLPHHAAADLSEAVRLIVGVAAPAVVVAKV